MKKLLLPIIAVAFMLTGCESLGLSTLKMNSENAHKRLVEYYTDNIDTQAYKPIEVFWQEGEKLSNDLTTMIVSMVGTDNKLYKQSFTVAGQYQDVGEIEEARAISKKYNFETMHWLKPEDIDNETILRYYDEATQYIPDGYNFESIARYTMKIDPASGKRSDYFKILLTKRGEAKERRGNMTITNYYELELGVLEDGTLDPKFS